MQKPKVGLCFVYLRDRQLQSLGSKGGKAGEGEEEATTK